MAFQKFKKLNSKSLSIYSGGVISLNRALIAELGLGTPDCATLYFDPDTSSVGIEFTSLAYKSDDSYKVTNTTHAIEVNACSFVKTHGVKAPSKYEDVRLENVEGRAMVVFQVELAQ